MGFDLPVFFALVEAGGVVVLGVAAILLGRRGQRNVERTLGRLGGVGTARAGRLLGFLSLCLGLIAALALGFYELLNYLG